MKLITYVTRSSGLSRRQVMEKLKQGRISVNGQLQGAATVEVEPGRDRVSLDGRLVRHLPDLHLMMYKPRATICTRSDPEGRPTVYEILRPPERRAATVGRLDYNTTGLLLFTTDGDLAQKLMLPRTGVTRTYLVKLKGDVGAAPLDRWRTGLTIQGRSVRATAVRIASRGPGGGTVHVTITEGINHQIHRMAEAVGLMAVKIHRMRFGGLTLGDLRPGGYRPLSSAELDRIRKLVRR